MSLDLLKEFGPQSQNPQNSMLVGTVDQRPPNEENLDDEDFGDFEVPDHPTLSLKQDTAVIEEKSCSANVSSHGDLVDLTDGSSILTPSSSSRESAADIKLGDPKSLLERSRQGLETRTPLVAKRASLLEGRRPVLEKGTEMSKDALQSQKPEASLISEESSAFEKLEDQGWDDFVEQSVPPDDHKISTLHENLRKENVDPKQRPTKRSGALSSPRDLIGGNATSNEDSHDSELIKLSRPFRIGHLGPAPSNVPPPSILLLLVENLFESLSTNTKKILSLTDASDQSKVDQLRFQLSMVRAAARVIAGRKLRWKRDTHLSQSMKIGPAHSGKTGGMKLTGVDRTESLREDREVAEALSIWRKRLGGLRSAITMANADLGITVPFIPDISENMPVRGAKLEDGGLTAPKSCFLCGLKRDERLERIDVDVHDSFGEWWTDHWGHLDCHIFWEKHRVSLGQRR